MYILLFYNLLNADMTIHDLFNSLKNNVTRKQLFTMQLSRIIFFPLMLPSTINEKIAILIIIFIPSFSCSIEI